jgi:hypothetical protein
MQLASDTDIHDDMGGAMSIRFTPGSSFNDYCRSHIPNYDAERLQVLAIRFYYGRETIVTLYAMDKDQLHDDDGEIPVKKFKLTVNFLKDVFPHIEECNFTLTTGHYALENMRVINK